MTKKEKVLYNENLELAEWIAVDMACVEAGVELLFKEAKESLRKLVSQYDAEKHGGFEAYATAAMRRDLSQYINSSGNKLFSIERRELDLEGSFFEDGEDFLETELENMHREWGWDDPDDFEVY